MDREQNNKKEAKESYKNRENEFGNVDWSSKLQYFHHQEK